MLRTQYGQRVVGSKIYKCLQSAIIARFCHIMFYSFIWNKLKKIAL